MISLEDAKDAMRLAVYLTNRLKEPIDETEVQSASALSAYLNRNSKKGTINQEDVADVNKLCNFINRITR